MSLTASIDKAGRIVIPKALRDQLGLEPGTELRLDPQEDSFSVTPIHPEPRMKRVDGFWILSGGGPADFDIVEDIRRMREERDRHNWGGDDQ